MSRVEYCASFGRCSPGCRISDPNGCPSDLTCHPELNDCVNFICDEDAQCPDWQYCAFEGRCRDGCRENGCSEGLTCGEDHVCRASCNEDMDCAENQYCDQDQSRCRMNCDSETHRGCGANEACIEGRCTIGCADDRYEIEGDQSLEDALTVQWALGEEGGVRSSALQSRTLCPQDEDWLKVSLAEGERVEVFIAARPSSGPLAVSLLNANEEVLKTSDPWLIEQNLRYPEPNQGVSAGDYYIRVTSIGQIEAHPYQLEVRVAPQSQSCFSDRLDPNDDTPAGSREIGLTPALRFTEQGSGDLCYGDQDHYCFPMSVSDGLNVFCRSAKWM